MFFSICMMFYIIIFEKLEFLLGISAEMWYYFKERFI